MQLHSTDQVMDTVTGHEIPHTRPQAALDAMELAWEMALTIAGCATPAAPATPQVAATAPATAAATVTRAPLPTATPSMTVTPSVTLTPTMAVNNLRDTTAYLDPVAGFEINYPTAWTLQDASPQAKQAGRGYYATMLSWPLKTPYAGEIPPGGTMVEVQVTQWEPLDLSQYVAMRKAAWAAVPVPIVWEEEMQPYTMKADGIARD